MNNKQKSVIIIGAGAAGLAAAIAIKRQSCGLINVILLEKSNKIGRKILASGNGRCNLTNSNINEHYYNNPQFLQQHLNEFGFDTIKNFYNSLGLLLSKPDAEGRVYPMTYSSTSVLDCYLHAINHSKIDLKLNCDVKEIKKIDDKYLILADESGKNINLYCDYLIFAYGSRALYGLENHFSLENLTTTNLSCSLCPVLGDKSELKYLENIRVKADVTLEYSKNNSIASYSERGEVLFRKDKISGIVMFNISAILARNNIKDARINIDLLPDYSFNDVLEHLKNNAINSNNLTELLTGICASGITKNIIEKRLNKNDLPKEKWNIKFFNNLVTILKCFSFQIRQNTDFKDAQVVAGGISLNCIDNKTFECINYPKLFVIGEALDVDGVCGGFNLHFAVSSALSAAKEIANNALN